MRLVRELPAQLRLLVGEEDVRAALRTAGDADEREPERAAFRHATAADGTGAPDALAAAIAHVREAAGTRDRFALVAALASLAESACDVADPYLVEREAESEADGARAWFGDALGEVSPETLGETGTYAPDAEGARELARESAALREHIEQAVLAGDAAEIASLRDGRLAAACALARAALRTALPGDVAAAHGRMRLAPEPLRGAVTLTFSLPAAGAGRLEMFDVAGRRMLSHELGRLNVGEHALSIPDGVLASLPSGVYLARVNAGGAVAEVRCTRLAD